jgi:hypothetical protein
VTEPARSPIGARQVVLLAAAAVVFVLGLQVVSALVPGLGDALELWPLLIVAMVAVTLVVLYRALRPRRG